jgi:hypothetical protein
MQKIVRNKGKGINPIWLYPLRSIGCKEGKEGVKTVVVLRPPLVWMLLSTTPPREAVMSGPDFLP